MTGKPPRPNKRSGKIRNITNTSLFVNEPRRTSTLNRGPSSNPISTLNRGPSSIPISSLNPVSSLNPISSLNPVSSLNPISTLNRGPSSIPGYSSIPISSLNPVSSLNPPIFYENVAFYDTNFYKPIELDVKSIPTFSIFKEKVPDEWPLSYRTRIEGKLVNVSTYPPEEKEKEIKKLYDYIITEKLSEYIIPSSNFLDLYFYNERTKKYNKSTNLQINLKNLCFYEIIDIKNMNGNIPIMSKNNAGIFNCSKTSMKGYPNISYIVINNQPHLLIPSNIQGKIYFCYGTICKIEDFFILVIREFQLYQIVDIYLNPDQNILNTIKIEYNKDLRETVNEMSIINSGLLNT